MASEKEKFKKFYILRSLTLAHKGRPSLGHALYLTGYLELIQKSLAESEEVHHRDKLLSLSYILNKGQFEQSLGGYLASVYLHFHHPGNELFCVADVDRSEDVLACYNVIFLSIVLSGYRYETN
jgi:hypothetical protein